MIKLLVLAVVLAVALAAGGTQAKDQSFCEQTTELATAIMKARQSGVPMIDLIKLSEETASGTEMQNLIKLMVTEAYKKRAYNHKENQDRAVVEFANEYTLACIQAV